MVNIQTLDERIKARALQEAKYEAEAAIRAIPNFSDFNFQVEIKRPTKEVPWGLEHVNVKIETYKIKLAIQKAIEERIYERRVEELAQKLLSAVDQIEELSAVVGNLQAQS